MGKYGIITNVLRGSINVYLCGLSRGKTCVCVCICVCVCVCVCVWVCVWLCIRTRVSSSMCKCKRSFAYKQDILRFILLFIFSFSSKTCKTHDVWRTGVITPSQHYALLYFKNWMPASKNWMPETSGQLYGGSCISLVVLSENIKRNRVWIGR